MRRSLNTFQAMETNYRGELNGGKSETIPNQAITAPELLRRYATGQPLGFKNVTPVYDDPSTDSIPEFYKLNSLDRLHFLQENTERVKDAQSNLKYYQRIEQQNQALKEQQQQKQDAQIKSETEATKSSGSPQAKT